MGANDCMLHYDMIEKIACMTTPKGIRNMMEAFSFDDTELTHRLYRCLKSRTESELKTLSDIIIIFKEDDHNYKANFWPSYDINRLPYTPLKD